jgi:hypothetical protein
LNSNAPIQSVLRNAINAFISLAESFKPNSCTFPARVFTSATAPILRGGPLGGESERTIFAFFTLRFRKHTLKLRADEVMAKDTQTRISIITPASELDVACKIP